MKKALTWIAEHTPEWMVLGFVFFAGLFVLVGIPLFMYRLVLPWKAAGVAAEITCWILLVLLIRYWMKRKEAKKS